MNNRWSKPLILGVGFLILWQLLVLITQVPAFIIPSPWAVLRKLWTAAPLIAKHSSTTLLEIFLGLLLGVLFGAISALLLQHFTRLRPWLMPILLLSQAIPVFALAPILMLWLGYGIAPKVVMSMLIIYFPVTVATFDGLRHTPQHFLDLAHTMNASPWRILWRIRIPAALPAFASGMRVAAAFAPIGAVIGEWIGGSQGLGYLMIHANARLQIDLMFAALIVLSCITLALYFGVDYLLNKLIDW